MSFSSESIIDCSARNNSTKERKINTTKILRETREDEKVTVLTQMAFSYTNIYALVNYFQLLFLFI
jgi:hypothetical protein